MSIIQFKPVQRTGSRVIITAYSESSGGKTHSLLRLGRGLVGPKGKLVMIDTENGRGRIFANAVPGGYDYGELTPPFTPERYIEALDDAEAAGADAVVLDSGSHEWEGLGGVLDLAEASGGKGLLKWMNPKVRHKRYVQRLLRSPMHLLISLRAKEKFVQLTKEDRIPDGMRVGDILSRGMIPVQDKRFIFETTVQLFFPDGNEPGVPSLQWPQFKCPKDLEMAFPEGVQISEETGRLIAEWVAGGAPVDREYETLKKTAEDVAEMGSEKLRLHWEKTLNKGDRKSLADQLDNLKSIAAMADKALVDEQVPAAPTPEPPAVEQNALGSALPQAGQYEDALGLPISDDEAFCDAMLRSVLLCTSLEAVANAKLAWAPGSLHHDHMERLPKPLWDRLMEQIGQHETALHNARKVA